MRTSVPIVIALLLASASCGGAAPAESSPTRSPAASPSPTAAAVASSPYSPKAEGSQKKNLVAKPRNISVSAPGLIWIVSGPGDGTGVSAGVSDKDIFTASYQAPADRQAAGLAKAVYVTPDLPPQPAALYGESLTLVTVQPGGRSAAHMHPGIEGVLVLDGHVLVRTAGHVPADLLKGQGFYILPETPIQLINIGATVARTLVYSLSPNGAPFSIPVDTAP